MTSPLDGGAWHDYDSVLSTQDPAAVEVELGTGGVFFSQDQTLGRGRFGREWLSEPGDSLTMSLAFMTYADHPRPYLIGMAVAAAAASVLHCELQWPNDLVLGARKVGGILTEIVLDKEKRRIAVVGVGINLNQKQFPPEIADRATSFALYHGGRREPREIAAQIVDRLASLPEPDSWASLSPVWSLFDFTPGKSYRLGDGREAIALGIGTEGQLIASVDGETMTILAADAIFGG